jgi:hypothetical protein
MLDYSGLHLNRRAIEGYSHKALVQDKVQRIMQQDWPESSIRMHQGLGGELSE